MSREGTVVLLGAGASADAGYPTATGLLQHFRILLHETSEEERASATRMRKHIAELTRRSAAGGDSPNSSDDPPESPTVEESFASLWQIFEEASAVVRPLAVPKLSEDGRPELNSSVFPGPAGTAALAPYTLPLEGPPPPVTAEPYLEDFFAFYDDLLQPRLRAALTQLAAPEHVSHTLRKLRQIAIKAAYRNLAPKERDPASYLQRLFDLDGPTRRGAPIATLNFDLTVEQLALDRGIPLFDGFGVEMGEYARPISDDKSLLNLLVLQETVSRNSNPFVGFQTPPLQTPHSF